MNFHKFLFLFSLLFVLIFPSACSKDYKDFGTPNGKQALLDEVNRLLSHGRCDEAHTILTPLYNSSYSDDDVKLTYSSVYGCYGGLSLISILGSLLSDSTTDIWALLIKSNYSSSDGDGKIAGLLTSASIIRETSYESSSSANYYKAVTRPQQANVMMVFTQLSIVALTISQSSWGNADSASGKKTVAITGKGTNEEKCRIANAFFTIENSLHDVGAGEVFTDIENQITALCGSQCSSGTLNPSVCTATEQTVGTLLIAAIDLMWKT